MIYYKTCVMCGGSYVGKNIRSCVCSTHCSHKRAAMLDRIPDKETRNELRRMHLEMARKTSMVTKKPSSLAEIAGLAREAGMSYGQYVAERVVTKKPLSVEEIVRLAREAGMSYGQYVAERCCRKSGIKYED